MTTMTPRTGAPHARILGVGSYRPARVVTNAEICEVIDSTDEWIRERSGIVERRFAADDETVADMAVAAAGKAIAHAGVAPDQIDAVVLASVTHLLATPSAAVEVGYRLGARLLLGRRGCGLVRHWRLDACLLFFELLVFHETPSECSDYETGRRPALTLVVGCVELNTSRQPLAASLSLA